MPKRKSECINETTKNELTEAVKNTKLISLTAKILSEVINENSSFILNSTPLNQSKYHFHSKTQAKISIKSYLERILRFTHCEESSLIMALIYIDKLCEVNNFILTYANIHRIILISIVIATKFNEDECYTNKYYAKVGGVPTNELNLLEFEFLKLLKYDLFVNKRIYYSYKKYLIDAFKEKKNSLVFDDFILD